MKWLLIVVLSLVGLLLLIVLVGALLPQKHHVSRTVTLRQSVETVWSLISGPRHGGPTSPTIKTFLLMTAATCGVRPTSTGKPSPTRPWNLPRHASWWCESPILNFLSVEPGRMILRPHLQAAR